MVTAAQGTRSSFFYGWVIVWATFVLLMIMSGITYSTPVLFHFFEADFAIGRAQAAFLFSCSQVVAFLIGAVAGGFTDKAGPRIAVGSGLVAMAAGLVGAAMARSYPMLVIFYGVAVGLGSGSIYVPLLGLIQRWFYRRRGAATGLATTGVGIGTLVFPVVAAGVANAFGWRVLYVGFAGVCLAVGLTAVSFLVADPKLRGLAPDGIVDDATQPSRDQAVPGMSLGEVLRDRAFYLIYFSSFGAAVLSLMAFVHLPQQLAESGGDRMQAATIISVIGLFSLAARLGGGAWADRVGRVVMIRVALVIMLLTSVLWAANAWTPSAWSTGVFFVVAALFGVTYGLSIALLPTVIADSFGNKQISKIIGVAYTSFALASFVGPTIAGLLHDRYGDYSLALAGCMVLSALSLAASFGIRKRF
jgi:MFS transporter, OFA family, oxalate/formate antiporter